MLFFFTTWMREYVLYELVFEYDITAINNVIITDGFKMYFEYYLLSQYTVLTISLDNNNLKSNYILMLILLHRLLSSFSFSSGESSNLPKRLLLCEPLIKQWDCALVKWITHSAVSEVMEESIPVYCWCTFIRLCSLPCILSSIQSWSDEHQVRFAMTFLLV